MKLKQMYYGELLFNIQSIVMEYADDGDLFQKIVRHKKKGVYINERTIWKIAIQMLRGKISIIEYI